MLVEVDGLYGPTLVEVHEAYPDKTMLSKVELLAKKDIGRTRTVLGVLSSPYAYLVDLTYEEFRSAYARSVKNQEPFLDVKADALEQIKRDYLAASQRHNANAADAHLYRPA